LILRLLLRCIGGNVLGDITHLGPSPRAGHQRTADAHGRQSKNFPFVPHVFSFRTLSAPNFA
jgi:hypothetical protein